VLDYCFYGLKWLKCGAVVSSQEKKAPHGNNAHQERGGG
jgi:hypothetical protein